MTDPAIGAACAATSALCVPLLLQVGIDLPSGIGGAVGVVIVQTLIERDGAMTWRTYLKLVAVTVGSVLFAAMANPLVAPGAIKSLALAGADVGDHHVRGATAALLGGFAQPILLHLKRRWLPRKLERALPGAPKEGREP